MVEVFNSTRIDGPMSENKKFYSDSMTREDIKADLLERRKKLGEKYGFDGTKILVPYQNLEHHDAGHYEDVTDLMTEITHDDPDTDLWDFDIPCDIMMIRSELKGVVLAYPVADCPVIIAKAGDTLALAHCGAKEIDRLLPMQVISAVEKHTGIDRSDMIVRIGSCANRHTYVYEAYPNWATSDMWGTCIEEKEDRFHIDMRGAISLQLRASGIIDCLFNERDTITNLKLYSNYAAHHGDETKDGRFLVGTYFAEKKVKVYEKKYYYANKR